MERSTRVIARYGTISVVISNVSHLALAEFLLSTIGENRDQLPANLFCHRLHPHRHRAAGTSVLDIAVSLSAFFSRLNCATMAWVEFVG